MTLPVLAPSSAAASRRSRRRGRLVDGAFGQQRPGQGDVLELAHVAELVGGGQASLTRPAERPARRPLRDPHPRPDGRDGPHVGEEVGHEQPLRLVEQHQRAVQVSFGLPDPGHRDPAAVRVLRQPGLLAELLAPQHLPPGGGHVVALAVDLAHPDVHVGRAPQHRPAVPGRESQRLLVGAHRLAEPALRPPDVPLRDRAPEGVGEVPGPTQPRHALGVRPVPVLEVPARPRREPQQPRGRGAAEVVPLRRPIERPPGVLHGVGNVAPGQGQRGPVQLDHAREAGELLLVDDNPLRRWGVQPPLGVAQPVPDAVELAAGQQRPGQPDAEHGPDPHDLVRKGLEPATQRGVLPAPANGGDRPLDQVRRPPVSSSTSASVISAARSAHSTASNVSRTGRGAARRSDGYERTARARHASTSFSLASANNPGGSPSVRTAASLSISRSRVSKLTQPGPGRSSAQPAAPAPTMVLCRLRR